MRFYPQLPGQRIGTISRDLLIVALLLLFALFGKAVHDAVDALAVLGEGVRSGGESVRSGFEAAADAVDGTPIVGGDIADGLRDAGEASGGNVAELGQSGEDKVHYLANLLGFVTFAAPAALLLLWMIPPRIRQIRQLTAASRVLREPAGERRRLLAMRAAFALPYSQLLRYTKDPIGDLAADRYEPLVEAVLEDAGLRPSKMR
ncbi:MAG: hypothetical protein ACJ75P_03285 [Gaiellaceae bacterium]